MHNMERFKIPLKAPRMPNTPTVTLGLVQHACPLSATPAQNMQTACDMIRQAASQGAQIVATQELFLSPYFPQTEDQAHFDLAEPVPGPSTQTLGELARELQIEITASLFEKRAPGLYHNTSVMIALTGDIIGRYRKMHIPDDPRFFEKYYFTPGDPPDNTPDDNADTHAAWQTQTTRFATTGMLVCWDQWFPEAARLTALRGAQILFYPTAIGWQDDIDTPDQHRQQREAWQILQRSHAIANGLFVAAINRIGTENDIRFWGSSFICDPTGQVIAQAPADQPAVLVAQCDLSLIDQTRKAWPFLRDRRIDAYANLTRRLID
jgi:N-carbamoylputrescine amidase